MASFAFAANATGAPLVIGTFDSTRAGIANVVDGPLTNELRASLATNLPDTTLVGTANLTTSFLSGIDVLLVHNAAGEFTPLSPLTVAEQTAVVDFIDQGGRAVVIADGFYGAGASNLLVPFGITMSTFIAGDDLASFTNPLAHPVSNGPFGLVSTYLSRNVGWFSNLGPYATALATTAANSEPALAVIEAGIISPTSGRVVIINDANAFADGALGYFFPVNEPLFLNIIAYAAVPEPSTGLLAGIAFFACVIFVRKKASGT